MTNKNEQIGRATIPLPAELVYRSATYDTHGVKRPPHSLHRRRGFVRGPAADIRVYGGEALVI
jgi:hypothetical protein